MQGPLECLERWDAFVQDRYDPDKRRGEFRKFSAEAPQVVQEFYRQNHRYQTRDFVLQKKREYLSQEGCGLDKVDLSWGHDEYLYHVVKDYLPIKRCI